MILSYAFMVRQEGAQAGEAGIDALHPSPLVGVGNLPADSLLLLHDLAGGSNPAPCSSSPASLLLLLVLLLLLLHFNLKQQVTEEYWQNC